MQQKYDDPQPQHALIPMPPPTGPTIVLPRPNVRFSKCPLFCNLFAYFCCPLGALCALPGVVYGIMGYSEYRVHDLVFSERYNRRSRHCAIAAIVMGCIYVGVVMAIVILYSQYLYTVLYTIIDKQTGGRRQS